MIYDSLTFAIDHLGRRRWLVWPLMLVLFQKKFTEDTLCTLLNALKSSIL